MGHLTVYSEHGTPHAGVYLEFDQAGINGEWLGFFPSAYTAYGKVNNDDRSGEVADYARWRISDSVLYRARTKMITDYYSAIYQLLVCDCVSFTREFAIACGMRIGAPSYFIPKMLLVSLMLNNPGHSF